MPTPPKRYPVKWVSKKIIRHIFNSSQCWNDTKSGELTTRILKSNHGNYESKGEPYCTKSQYVIYLTKNGEFVAAVHQYLRPDGKLGASGKPDPKRVLIKGEILAVRIQRKGGRARKGY
jgi:hypothetical protein